MGHSPTGKKVDEFLTRHGAERLAGKIQAYWARRGKDPEARVDMMSAKGGFIYVVSTNMIDGVPQRDLDRG